MPYVQMPGWVGAQQDLQENQLFMESQRSDLQSAALNQENARLQLEAKKAELANEAAFKANILQKLSGAEETRNELADLAGQPTPYQQKQAARVSLEDKLNSHISILEATQKAVDEYSKVDPIYAQKQQALLNEQIKQGFELAKEHNKMKEEQSTQLSNELFPVLNAEGQEGKLDEGAYRALYQRHLEEGTPLASMGLTGNLQQDKDRLRVIYSQGVAAKDQAAQHARAIAEQERQWKDRLEADKFEETKRWRRANEAISRERLDKSGRGGAVKDPVVVERKDQDAAYGRYRSQYDRLVAERRKTTDPVAQRDIDRQITSLNDNFEEQKKAIRGSYGLVNKGQSQASSSSVEDDLISKYSK